MSSSIRGSEDSEGEGRRAVITRGQYDGSGLHTLATVLEISGLCTGCDADDVLA